MLIPIESCFSFSWTSEPYIADHLVTVFTGNFHPVMVH